MPRTRNSAPQQTRTPGTPKPNRVDLNQPMPHVPPQPVRVPTGLPYGEHQQLEDTQQAQPLPDFQQAMAAAVQAPPPQALLSAPTSRPSEPIQAGLDQGPGPGSEVIGQSMPRISDTFRSLAMSNNDRFFADLADQARSMGY